LTLSDKFDPQMISDTVTVFDAEQLPAVLILSKREDGDKIIPFGNKRRVKLKKLLTEQKLTAREKEHLIVLRSNDGTIIWVPTIRHSAFANVTEGTRKVAYIEMTS
jgi:tRNA(Ile)-lysidine synthetase-like protein